MSKHRRPNRPVVAPRPAPLAPRPTAQVIADREKVPDDLVAPGELLDLRFQSSRTTLGLRAAKLLHLLIKAAGADVATGKVHRIALRKLAYDFHLSKSEILDTLRELFGVSVELKILNSRGRKALKIGPLLADVEQDEDDDGELRYEFSPVLRAAIKNSNHWAVLSRRAVLAFQSRYSLRLYELISLRVGLDHVTRETFTLDDLRARFGVPHGKLKTWQAFKERVIEPAIEEVSHLTGLAVEYAPVKRGRSVSAVCLVWREKDRQARAQAARELDGSSIGRAARRTGAVDAIVNEADRGELAAALAQLGRAVVNRG